jgi:hypothetical protein
MLMVTDYPVMMWDCSTNPHGFASHGIPEGGQIPWARANQRLVWKRPTMKDLMAAVEHEGALRSA